jgi:thioredoxin reductase (NADPH)
MMNDCDYNVIIIGGGPAGVAAAIYCKRALMKTLLIEKGPIGGMLLVTDLIENYPGYSSVHGYELALKFEEHLKKYEVEILQTYVNGLTVDDESPRVKTVSTEKGDFTSHAVIIATGGTPQPLEVDRYDFFLGRGVSTCAICDAHFYKGKVVAVIGGGDAAVDESIYLSRFVAKLHLVHRRDKLRAEEILQKELMSKENVQFVWDSVLEEISGKENVQGIRVRNLKSGDTREIKLDGIFNYTGHRPNTDWVKADLRTNEGGYIVTDQQMASSIPGLYAAGDVRAGTWRQAVIAAGEGAMAALSAEQYVREVCGIEPGSR